MLEKIIAIAKLIVTYLFSILKLTAKLLGALLLSLIDLLFPAADKLLSNKRILSIKRKFPKLWKLITSSSLGKKYISRGVFKKFGRTIPARPHQHSMASSYTRWNGLVDRHYSGRHLKEHYSNNAQTPTADELVDLCLRSSTQEDCIRSSFLFASFAQWFTDSFLRTSQLFEYDDDGNVLIDPTSNLAKRKPGREKYNDSNHEIDLCQIYGLNEKQTRILRSHSTQSSDKGCLAYQLIKDEEFPKFLLIDAPDNSIKPQKLTFSERFSDLYPDEKVLRFIFRSAENNENGYTTLFATGLEHGNSTIGNSLMNVVFLRAHNAVARRISHANPDWNSDQVFETARNVMIVLLLKIVISDYIRHISPLDLPLEFQKGLAEKENWYRPNRISIEFNLLYRWHGLVPDSFSFLNSVGEIRHNNQWLIDQGVARTIELFSNERAGKIVLGNTPTFLKLVEKDTINLMRASKLATYNEYRINAGLAPISRFSDMSDSTAICDQLKSLYADVNSVEWYIGLFAEKHSADAIMGDLMLRMVGHDAFTQALTNPLLSNQVFKEETFSGVGWKIVNSVSTLQEMLNLLVFPDQKINCSFSYIERH